MKKSTVMVMIVMLICFSLLSEAWAKPIKVGFPCNLTGPSSQQGQAQVQGMQHYFRYIEEKGGIGGNTIDLILVDAAYKIPEAVAAAKKFAMQDDVVMIFAWSSGEGLAIKPIIQQYKLPTIGFSLAPDLMEPPIDYFFLPLGTHRTEARGNLEYLLKIHKGKEPPKVGLLTYNNAYGRAIHKPSEEYAKEHNIKIVGIEEFPPQTVDLTTEMLRLKAKGAEYISAQLLGMGFASALKAADRLKYDVKFFGGFGLVDMAFLKLGKGLVGEDKMFFTSPYYIPGDPAPADKLMKEVARYGVPDLADAYDTAYMEGFCLAAVTERVIRRAHERFGDVNRETVNKAMELFNNEDFGGLIPKVSFSKTDHAGIYQTRVVECREGNKVVPRTNFFTPGKGEMELLKVK